MAYGGLLHQNLAWPLIEISKLPSVSFVAFVSKASQDGDKSRLGHSGKLCINVYGSKRVSGTVASVLDAAGIYLQHPFSTDLGVPYFNPHILIRPGGDHPAPSLEQHLSHSKTSSLNLSNLHSFRNDILQIMDYSAQGPSEYTQFAPGVGVRATLKP